jgi:hypothetical protein
MSLAIAVHKSAGIYGIAADTRFVAGIGGMHVSGSKVFRRGAWAGGFIGSLPDAQAFLRALGDIGETVEEAEAALFAAWETATTKRGTKSAAGDPWIDVDVLLVGPPGIVRLSAFGSTTRHVGRHAIGCAADYASGYLDHAAHDGEAVDLAAACFAIHAAAVHFPGVGGPVDWIQPGAPVAVGRVVA